MKYGIHLGYWGNDYDRLGVKECLRQGHEIGADAIELFPTEYMFNLNRPKIAEIRKVLDELHIEPVFTFGYPKGWDMTSEDSYSRSKAIEHIKRALDGLGALGSKTIGGIVYSNWPAHYDDIIIEPDEKKRRWERCVESLKRIMPTAADNDVTVNLEIVNRFEHYLMNTAAEGIAMCKEVGHPNCKILLDVFHMNIEEDDIPSAIRSSKDYIGHFHVSEPNRKVPYHSTRINWTDIGKALRDIGYNKSIILEPFLIFGGKQGHDMRLWRNLDSNISLENRLHLAKQGIAYIKEQFSRG